MQKQTSDLSERHNIRQELIFESEEHCILNTEALVQQIVEAKLQGADSGAWLICFTGRWRNRSWLPQGPHVSIQAERKWL